MKRRRPDGEAKRGASVARGFEGMILLLVRWLPPIVVMMGLWGWTTTCPGRFSDDFYKTIQLFGLNFDLPGQGCRPVTLPLHIARIGAGAVTLGFFLLLSRNARSYLLAASRWISRAPAVGVLGYGEAGRAIARRFRDGGYAAVAVSLCVEEADRSFAAVDGVELHEADWRHRQLDRWPVRLSRLRHVVVACDTDSDSIAAAMTVNAGQPAGDPGRQRLWLLLQSGALIHRLREGVDLLAGLNHRERRILPFQVEEAAARDLFERHPPVARALASAHKAVHLAIYGFNREFAWVVAQEAMLNGVMPAPSLRAPILSIVTSDPAQAALRWEARYPGLANVMVDGDDFVSPNDATPDAAAMLRFIGADLDALTWMRPGPLAALADIDPAEASIDALREAAPVNLHVFCLADDKASLAAALTLRLAMIRGDVPPAPIALHSAVGLMDLPEPSGRWQQAFFAVGNVAQAAPYFPFLNEELERTARLLAGASYDILPETLRVSNDRAAYHLAQKLTVLGFEGVSVLKPHFGLGRDGADWIKGLNEEDRARLGLWEHVRWRTDRLIDGWRGGPRDDERRRRPQLQGRIADYRDLGEAEWLKDTAHLSVLGSQSLPPCAVTRIVDHIWEGEPPAWQFINGRLILDFPPGARRPTLSEPSPGETPRLRLLIPPEKAWTGSGTPNDRRAAARAAISGFVASLPGRVVLERLSSADWEWLDPSVPERVEGMALPPLVVGFSGPTDPSRLGDPNKLAAAIHRWARQVSPSDGHMPLVTGLAPGADTIAIRCWRDGGYGPVLGLHPFGSEAKPRYALEPDAAVDQEILACLRERQLAATNDVAMSGHAAVTHGILDRATALLVVLSDSDASSTDQIPPLEGGTAWTLAQARHRRMRVRRIEPD